MSENLTAVRDFAESRGSVREKWPKTIICRIFASILEFAELAHFGFVSDHALLHSYPHH